LGNEAEQSPTTCSQATMVPISQRSDYTTPAAYRHILSARPSKTSYRIDCAGHIPSRRADFDQKAVMTSRKEHWSKVLRKADTSCNPKCSSGTTPMRSGCISHRSNGALVVLRVPTSGERLQTRSPCMRAVRATLDAGAVTAIRRPWCRGPPSPFPRAD
jgi:hypothetical protein